MKLVSNKILSVLLVVVAVSLLVFNISITSRLMEMNDQACATACSSDMEFCPYNHEVPMETFIISFIALLLGATGVYAYFALTPKEASETKRNPAEYEEVKKGLRDDEAVVLDMLLEEGGMYQSDIVEKTGFSKVKISRILDKLETRELIERRRRGMTNFIILK